jgi:hypothetical protein
VSEEDDEYEAEATPAESWVPLDLPYIEHKPKAVAEDKHFEFKIDLSDQQVQDLVIIRDLIAKGHGLPERFYRRSTVGDRLLKSRKIMHLHLGGGGSDALLYLIQYPDHVLFLTVDTHIHLQDAPVGKRFLILGIRRFEGALRAAIRHLTGPRDAD